MDFPALEQLTSSFHSLYLLQAEEKEPWKKYKFSFSALWIWHSQNMTI